ncbi:MAG: ATP-binding cassette domain-containing protein [Devosiaceae bacterium]|nr:ATP-binding cassette domain-containing protein [Devosiaceae bacterium MH13]
MKQMVDTSNAPLCLDGLEIRLGDRTLVSVTADVAPGGVLTVMGPSGSGKSTLLHALSGSLAPVFTLSGRAKMGSVDLLALPPETRRMGLLFQDALLFPHLSVCGNLMLAIPRGAAKGRAARQALAEEALAAIGLEGFGARDPATLSGGQAARVALQRTLLSQPRALLLDEPFSKLDAALRADMRALVFDHARARQLPVVMVTHDPDDAAAAGGPVFELE